MKLEREMIYLEKAMKENDFAKARNIIESSLDVFTRPNIRAKLSMEALTLLNCIIELNDGANKYVYSRETQLIIQHINSLAYDCRFAEIKRFTFLYKELLANPKIYSFLSADAKAFIAPPKETDVEQASL